MQSPKRSSLTSDHTPAKAAPEGRAFLLVIISFFLLVLTIAAFLPIWQCGFIRYDDPLYVTENLMVQKGLTWEGVKWAFTSGHASNWHPLTWISHMLDCQVFGLNAAGHHFTNLLFHLGNTILLFLLLHRLTGTVWRSALVAGLFAVHPMHVESVAWVAERKDVLSTCLAFISTWFYVSYARSKQASAVATGHKRSYAIALLFFALSLMSKPMWVTLPFVWMLLDWWPLSRFKVEASGKEIVRRAGGLFLEKVPFVALTLISSVITYAVQEKAIMSRPADVSSLLFKLAMIVWGYLAYIGKLLYPTKLAVFYPISKNHDLAVTLAGIVFLVAVSFLAFRWARRKPWFTVGWFWYLGTLVPVIGFVKVGLQSIADRYTYAPAIGLFVIVVWAAHWFLQRVPRRELIAIPLGIAVLLIASRLTWIQVGYWKNDRTLFQHALAVTSDNAVALDMLGLTLVQEEKWDEARSHFAKAVLAAPSFSYAYNHLGGVLLKQKQFELAVAYYRKAVALDASNATHFEGLGESLLSLGDVQSGLEASREATTLDPLNANAHFNLGTALMLQGKTNEAISSLERSIELKPTFPQAHNNLAFALNALGREDDAMQHYAAAVNGGTNFLGAADAHFGYANLLLKKARYPEAEHHFLLLLQFSPPNAQAYYQLGVIASRTGRDWEAAECWRQALKLRPEWPEAQNNLAWLLATSKSMEVRRREEALALAHAVVETRREAATLDTLAAAYASNDEYAKAVEVAEQALVLANQSTRLDLAAAISSRLALYKQNRPFRAP